MAKRRTKMIVDRLINLREELYGPMNDLSSYSLYSENIPGIYNVLELFLNTGIWNENTRTGKKIKEITSNMKKGEYSNPVLLFPCEFSLNAFRSLFHPLIKKAIVEFVKEEQVKQRRDEQIKISRRF